MSFEVGKDQVQVLVTLRDELTVADVRDLRNALLAAVAGPVPVAVDADAASRIDVSIVQVLCSVGKSTGRLTVPRCSAQVRDYLERAGVSIDGWAGAPAAAAGALTNGVCNG